MQKEYVLHHLGGNRFALSNETDRDPYTDYFPGYWDINTQRDAIRLCREVLQQGHEITAGIGDRAKVGKILQST